MYLQYTYNYNNLINEKYVYIYTYIYIYIHISIYIYIHVQCTYLCVCVRDCHLIFALVPLSPKQDDQRHDADDHQANGGGILPSLVPLISARCRWIAAFSLQNICCRYQDEFKM